MENASKALIIAGAILLSILIIALGMGVFNQAKEAMSGSSLSAEKAAAFNSKFEDYFGTSVKGTRVRALCDLVKNNNLTADESETYTIIINGYSDPAEISNTLKPSVVNGSNYRVTCTYNTDIGGMIATITITGNGISNKK